MKARRRFRVSEDDILKSCKFILNLAEGAGYLSWSRISSTGIPRRLPGGCFLLQKNPMEGISDLIVWIKNGPVICVELKTEDGELDEPQKKFRNRILRVGHQFQVVRSPEALEALLVAHGVPRITLLPS